MVSLSKFSTRFSRGLQTGAFEKIVKLAIGVSFKLVSLVISIYILKWVNSNLSQIELKEFNIFNTITVIILSLAAAGLGPVIQRKYIDYKKTQSDESKTAFINLWSLSICIQCIFFVVGLICLTLYYINSSFTSPLYLFYLLLLAQLMLSIDGGYKLITDANNKTWQFTITELFSKLLIFILLFFSTTFSFNSNSFKHYLAVIVFSAGFQLVADIILQKKYAGFKIPNLSYLKKYRTEITVFFINTLLSVASMNTDRLFLAHYYPSGLELNGYVNAYKFLEIAMVLENIIFPVLFFNLYTSNIHNIPYVKFIFKSPWFYLIFANSIGILLVYLLASRTFMGFIDSESKYTSVSFVVLPILGLALFTTTIHNLLTGFIVQLKFFKIEFISLLIYAITAILMYIVFIPRFGYLGAAYSTLAGSFIITGTKFALLIIANKWQWANKILK